MAFDTFIFKKVFTKLQGKIAGKQKNIPEEARKVTQPPSFSPVTSVEMALNSRCTSDYDGDPATFHWGMFDPESTFSDDVADRIISMVRIPRWTTSRVDIVASKTTLTFNVDASVTGLQREWMMIESGMQQQAVCLLCAACGIAMNFKTYGNNGTPGSGNTLMATRILFGPMIPSYNGKFWTDEIPSHHRPWRQGNLSDPIRTGNRQFTEVLNAISDTAEGSKADQMAISQLLWACRGRTPHFYKSEPWGMTIPVSHGQQSISTVHILSDGTINRYVNWVNNRPTHSLEKVGTIHDTAVMEQFTAFGEFSSLIVLAKNDPDERALWEIGYSLLNLIVQAQSLGVRYRVVLLNSDQIRVMEKSGISNPRAILLV